MYFLTWLFPPVGFFAMGRPIAGIVAFCLCCTIFLYPVALIWGIIACAEYNADKRTNRLIAAIEGDTGGSGRPTKRIASKRPTPRITFQDEPTNAANPFDFN